MSNSTKENQKNKKNPKSRRGFNVIDVVIIFLALALIGTAGYRIYSEITKNNSSKQSGHIVSFESEVGYGSIIEYLKNGDKVYLESDGTLLGYLYDPTANDDKNAVYKEIEEEAETLVGAGASKTVKLRGTLKLSSDAVKSKSGNYYVLNGTNITVGSKVKVYTEKAEMTILVKDIYDEK